MAVMDSAFVHTQRGYPWHEWSNGEWWKAKSGEDFHVSTRSFKGAIYNHARRHKLRAQVQHLDDGPIVRLRFTKKPPGRPAKKGAKR